VDYPPSAYWPEDDFFSPPPLFWNKKPPFRPFFQSKVLIINSSLFTPPPQRMVTLFSSFLGQTILLPSSRFHISYTAVFGVEVTWFEASVSRPFVEGVR